MSVSVFFVVDIGGIVFRDGALPLSPIFSRSTFVPYLAINGKRVAREKPKPVKERKKRKKVFAPLALIRIKAWPRSRAAMPGGIINQFTCTWHRR